jgi:periplasmic protein CpxP/Spy
MRFPKISELASILLGMALSCALAAAQTSSPPGSSQPEAATPTQTAPPSEQSTQPAGAQNPSSSQAGAQSGADQSGAHASTQSGGGSSIDDELQLTPDQKQKIAAVVDDENKQIAAVRDDGSMSLEQKQQKVLQIRQAGTPKIKAILTPDQLQKLAAIQQRMRDQQQSGQQQPAPQNPAPQSSAPPQH